MGDLRGDGSDVLHGGGRFRSFRSDDGPGDAHRSGADAFGHAVAEDQERQGQAGRGGDGPRGEAAHHDPAVTACQPAADAFPDIRSGLRHAR